MHSVMHGKSYFGLTLVLLPKLPKLSKVWTKGEGD